MKNAKSGVSFRRTWSRRESSMRLRRTVWGKFLPLILVAGLAYFAAADDAALVDLAHGVKLPKSAANVQHCGDSLLSPIDAGRVTVFECDQTDYDALVASLDVTAVSRPVDPQGSAGKVEASPLRNGRPPWAPDCETFVPGNAQYAQLVKTWIEPTFPIAAYSCTSPRGDFLHVECYRAGERIVVKMYTDRN
jgi:hypothetical protein